MFSKKFLIIVAVLLVLVGGGGFAAWKWFPQSAIIPEVLRSYQEGDVKTETVQEKTDTYSIKVEYPQFGISAVDEKIKEGIGTLVDEFKKIAESNTGDMPYELESSFDDPYVDDEIISTRLIVSMYTGGAHPSTTIYGLNYSRKTGKEISLDSVLKLIGATLAQVAEITSVELEKKLGSSFVREGAEPKQENYWIFSINEKGVTFIFNEYQVAPYAAGPQGVSFARAEP